MKWSSLLLKGMSLGALLTLTIACEQECNCPEVAIQNPKATRNLDEARPVRERLVSLMEAQVSQLPTVNRFVYSPAMLPGGERPATLDLLDDAAIEAGGQDEAYANVEAAELVTSIFNALVAAESSADILNINLSFSEEAIEDDLFVFAIEAPKAQELNFTLHDEEGFEKFADNRFVINEGNNYKAINLKSLPTGSYILRLQNETEGKELVRRIDIANED